MTDVWPTDIRVRKEGRTLAVAFDNGQSGDVSAELLRVESPSAEVKGHGPGQEQLVWGKRNVRITKIESVGNYAIRLTFDDGHATGIYTWPYLQKLVGEGEAILKAYEAKLVEAGRTRN